MDAFVSFMVSFIASLAVVVVVYLVLQRLSSYWLQKGEVGETKCWFLPRWNCFRVVVRNIPGNHTLLFIKWRAWLRAVIPAQPGCSVKTFVDTDLDSGERIYLPAGQDLPVACFRFNDNLGKVELVLTDKLGKPVNSYALDDIDSIMLEYHAAVRHWFVFKHDVNRIVFMPLSKEEVRGKTIDFVRDYYLAKQKTSYQNRSETQVKVFKLEEEITAQL